MLNYEVDPALLDRYVPRGTVLDSFEGKTYLSLVGFQFRRTKLFGSLHIPLHANFDEVNLRFYVRRKDGADDRRGVVFIAEIVPKRAVAQIARFAYGENYVRLPMRHSVTTDGDITSAAYEWRLNGAWCRVYAHGSAKPAPAAEGSLQQFITEHYWGYSGCGKSGSLEYHVSHVAWNVSASADAEFEGDVSSLYGTEIGRLLERPPHSAFIADGSPVTVFKGQKLR